MPNPSKITGLPQQCHINCRLHYYEQCCRNHHQRRTSHDRVDSYSLQLQVLGPVYHSSTSSEVGGLMPCSHLGRRIP